MKRTCVLLIFLHCMHSNASLRFLAKQHLPICATLLLNVFILRCSAHDGLRRESRRQ